MTFKSKAAYAEAIQWIADFDNSGDAELPDVLAGYLTVNLVADLFGKNPQIVGCDVFDLRPTVAS